MLKRLLAGREALLGPQYPSVMHAAHQLGRVLKKQGRFQEAETWYTYRGEGLDSYHGKDFMFGIMKSQRTDADRGGLVKFGRQRSGDKGKSKQAQLDDARGLADHVFGKLGRQTVHALEGTGWQPGPLKEGREIVSMGSTSGARIVGHASRGGTISAHVAATKLSSISAPSSPQKKWLSAHADKSGPYDVAAPSPQNPGRSSMRWHDLSTPTGNLPIGSMRRLPATKSPRRQNEGARKQWQLFDA